MNAVFADTAYWIALTNVQDEDHDKAKALSASLRQHSVITTETVLIEYLNYLPDGARGFAMPQPRPSKL
jgi:predicted nucleic acid-binding protein